MKEEKSISHFFRTLKENPIFTLVIVSMGLLFKLTPPFLLAEGSNWSNYKFILLALVPLLFGICLFFTDKKNIVPIHKADLSWGLMLLICVGSYFWSTNGSLVWYFFFGWLCLILWVFLVRWTASTKAGTKYLHEIFVLFFLGICFHFLVILSAGQLDIAERWNSHFGYNANYVSVYLLGFFPFLLCYPLNTIFGNALKLLTTLFITFVLWKAGVKGGAIAFFVLLFYFVWDKLPKRYFFWGFGITIFAGLLCITLIFPEQSKALYKFMLDEAALSGSHRYYMLKSSMNIFKDYPLLGVGTENWYIHAYQEDLSKVLGFNHCSYYNRLGTHNLYEKILTEWGLLGLLSFLIPLIAIFWKYLNNQVAVTALEKGSFGSLIVYCIVSLFYRDVNFYELHFSSFHLLAFCCVGILTATIDEKRVIPFFRIWLIISSTIALAWFIYYQQADNKYERANTYFYSYSIPDYELLDGVRISIYFDNPIRNGENLEEAIRLFENIYHPIFKTTHGYLGDRRGGQKLLALALAQLYEKIGRLDKAEQYYKLGLKQNPYEENLLRSYARFLIRFRNQPTKAKPYAIRAYQLQTNNFYSNLLLAEIAIKENAFTEAKNYLSVLESELTRCKHSTIVSLLKIELALAEQDYDFAKTEIDKLVPVRKEYQTQFNNLKQLLKQATENTVKE